MASQYNIQLISWEKPCCKASPAWGIDFSAMMNEDNDNNERIIDTLDEIIDGINHIRLRATQSQVKANISSTTSSRVLVSWFGSHMF